MSRHLLLFLALLVFTTRAGAQFSLGGGGASSEASLVSEATTVSQGETFTIALQLSHPEEWHSYYKNSGGVELPPAIEWKLPDGFTAGPIQWPVPEVKDGYFGKSFVYSGSPVFLVDITAPSTLESGKTLTFTANASWQICKDSCINEDKSLSVTLTTGPRTEVDPAQQALFAGARKSQPVVSPKIKSSAHSEGGDIQLRITDPGITGAPADFIPNERFAQPASAGGSITHDGDAWLVTLKRIKIDAFENAVPQGTSISGILTGAASFAIPATAIGSPPAKPLPFSAYLPILGGMFLGGLILNLMPCVFPVIGLKIMGFVQQAGSDRRKIAFHGVAFAVGVLVSFGVLSGILFAARAATGAGAAATGWGYQLQNPWVMFTLILLMFVLALNMFGLFELGTSATSVGGSLQSKQGLGGSFFSGVLATVVATPCSGPFLGPAIGATITLPAVQFFSSFTAMAIGLSLPYLILSIFPDLLKYLPRPGVWMESFKQAMSFLLFATAGYLLWVYAGQIGLDNMLGPILGLTAIAVAAWIYGRWNLPHRPRNTRWIAMAFTVIFAGGGFLLAKPPEKSALVWEPWSQERVDALLAEGKPVYIDFTAQWCATCQVNKKTAYTKEVIALMKQKGVVALKADKTNPDPKIEAKLQELGRTAIPVNVLQVPKKDAVVTPELLTSGYLKELFTKEIPEKK
ncbi:thioredoxin family protein [Luteolibacter yonseiensis]|uniref:Thioredoxin family protein n=1 Tax=Luteolibacter yonseiensis TaxID=1144680 RepID=A0A934R2Q8_9BACT|nr:protein-disulfide reductase DsbD domain-containing protein [Luteolibacter yonseiensis]MBK1815774.1 thioredoxin family protein [Luteolibacter yonseiensis]